MKASIKALATLLFLILSLPLVAAAQGAIQKISEPYVVNPEINFSIITKAPITPIAPVKTIIFEVTAKDRTIREVLQRWAHDAGWKHDQIHWTLNQDFPVEGTAGAEYFKSDFKTAVRTLLSSTQITDLPAQPCFYSNQVIRVVPQAELCDRTAMTAQ